MLILIEGPDGAGKTTLAERLKKQIDGSAEIRHCRQLVRHPLDEYEMDLDGYVPYRGQHIIYDRHLYGEDVYGPLYRGRSTLDDAMRWHVEAYLNSRGAVMVHLTTSVHELQRRHVAKNEDYLKYEHIRIVHDRFASVARSSTITHLVQCRDPNDDDVDAILRLAAGVEFDAAPLGLFKSYVGPLRPRYLLLGERHGGPDPGRYSASFVPHVNTSGHFLIKSLPHTIMRHIGIANACEEYVPRLWKVLHEPSICALGVESHKVVADAGLRHGRAPHPQWARRFVHSKLSEYGHIVTEAAVRELDLSGWRP